jgi:hypothetical protein
MAEATPLSQLNDGNYWYVLRPPNRWTCEGSPNAIDWCGIDFGIKRRIHTVKLYLLDDGEGAAVRAPAKVALEHWDGKAWVAVPGQVEVSPVGHSANVISFPALDVERVRVVLTHRSGARSGLSELEAWGDGPLPVPAAPPPAGNLAAAVAGQGFPKLSASFTSEFDNVNELNDGIIRFTPNPRNRWTSYQSPNASDWVEIDFGVEKRVGRVDLHVYDDRGGVQAPASYAVQTWDGQGWVDVANGRKDPQKPTGGKINTVTFTPVVTRTVRVVFVHQGKSRSGLTELEAWAE